MFNNNEFDDKNNYYYQNDNNQKNDYNNGVNESTGPIDGKKKQNNANLPNEPRYSNNTNKGKDNNINWQKGEENIRMMILSRIRK